MKKVLFFIIITMLVSCGNKQIAIKESLEGYLNEFNIKAEVGNEDESSLIFNLNIQEPYKMANDEERDLFISYLIYILKKEYDFEKIKIISFLDKESDFNKNVLEYSSSKLENLNSIFNTEFIPLVEYCMTNFQVTDVFEMDDMIAQIQEVLPGKVIDSSFYELLKKFSNEKTTNGKASFTFFILYRFVEDMSEEKSNLELERMKRLKTLFDDLWKLNKGVGITKKDKKQFNEMFSEAISN